MYIIDRRKNPRGRNLANTQRFFNRIKENIRESIDQTIEEANLEEAANDKGVTNKNIVTVLGKTVNEPSFYFDERKGVHNMVLPGNKNHENDEISFKIFQPKIDCLLQFKPGDKLYKPPNGRGSGSGGSPDGSGADDFQFLLTPEEYAKLFLEDLELPNIEEKSLDVESVSWERSGYTIAGAPANLDLLKTLKNSFGRRLGLHRPTEDELVDYKKQLENPFLEEDEKKQLESLIELTIKRMEVIPYLDPYDVRYTNFVSVPKPRFKAVMFCLMDVSGSMTEHMKDLAKRFYLMLYRFLKVKYEKVELVFIRHTTEASVVDEETFFYSKDTGGTVVSSGLKEVRNEISKHYNPEEWNIYLAQASDGDNFSGDYDLTAKILIEDILPKVQYHAYIETSRDKNSPIPFGMNQTTSELWKTYEHIAKTNKKLAMKKVSNRNEIYPIFRQLFSKKEG